MSLYPLSDLVLDVLHRKGWDIYDKRGFDLKNRRNNPAEKIECMKKYLLHPRLQRSSEGVDSVELAYRIDEDYHDFIQPSFKSRDGYSDLPIHSLTFVKNKVYFFTPFLAPGLRYFSLENNDIKRHLDLELVSNCQATEEISSLIRESFYALDLDLMKGIKDDIYEDRALLVPSEGVLWMGRKYAPVPKKGSVDPEMYPRHIHTFLSDGGAVSAYFKGKSFTFQYFELQDNKIYFHKNTGPIAVVPFSDVLTVFSTLNYQEKYSLQLEPPLCGNMDLTPLIHALVPSQNPAIGFN